MRHVWGMLAFRQDPRACALRSPAFSNGSVSSHTSAFSLPITTELLQRDPMVTYFELDTEKCNEEPNLFNWVTLQNLF